MLELYRGDVPKEWRDWAPTGKALELAVVALEMNLATARFFRTRAKVAKPSLPQPHRQGAAEPMQTQALARTLRRQLRRRGLKDVKSGAA